MSLVSECCGEGWDEDTGICLKCKEHCDGVHDNDYDHYEEIATAKGWTTPVNDVFSDETWVQYWESMEHAEENPGSGRPIAPHRSGSARILNEDK